MSVLELIKEKTDKDFNSVTKEDLLEIIESIENEKQELKRQKKYGLVWEEQIEDVERELEANYPILKEVADREIKTSIDKPTNLLIEGDNLHSLNTLLITHRGRISIIAIDPPYGTGNKDFIYNDSFVDKEDSWRHSKWLSFMNKRLRIAKELLSDDGVIFINIDDNEQAQLKLLCDEIFGEDNFIANFVWKKKSSSGTDKGDISTFSEYVTCYSKKKKNASFNKLKQELSGYNLKDNHYEKRGGYKLNKLDRGTLGYQESLDYEIECPSTGLKIYPNNRNYSNDDGWRWRWSKKKVKWGIENDFIVVKKTKNGISVYYKIYEKVDNNCNSYNRETIQLYSNLIPDTIGGTVNGTNELKQIFTNSIFDYPKPTGLIKYLINLNPNPNAIVLDFFAGSGTTGHAVLALNEEDGGNRQFILCTNNENNICEDVTYERLNKVINGYTTPKGKEVEGLGGNLKYYKTDFVSKDQDNYDIKIELADKCTELLCIKENCFDLKEQNEKDDYKIFESNEMVMAVYNDFIDYKVLNVIKETLLNSEQKTKVIYLFDGNANMNEFEIVEIKEAGIEVKFIPKKIMQIYEEVLKIC